MNIKKVLCGSISTLLLVFLTVSTAFCLDLQRIIIPYALVEGDWWTGLAVHNQSNDDQIFIVSIYDTDGVFIGGSGCLTVAPNATHTDLIENFTDETVTGRISVHITTNQNEKFSATMFLGNGGASQGFGFDTYTSEDYSGFLTLCGIIIPPIFPPVIIPSG